MRHDIKYAFRRIVGNRAFTAAAVLCLVLGIGTSTTGFSILDGVLIRPLPYRDAEQLVVLNQANSKRGFRFGALPHQDLVDWREQASAFTAMAGVQMRGLMISDGSADPERILGAAVGWELFPMLGVQPMLGRGIGEADDRPGAPPVIVLSHTLWQRRYAGGPDILGRIVRVDGAPHTVIGVMPRRFEFPAVHQAWIPLVPVVHDRPRADHVVTAFARVKPGLSLDRVRDELGVVAGRLAQQYPENRDWTPLVRPMRDFYIPEDIKLVLLTVMGAVTLVLLVACANVANLLLAQASARQREITVRAAVGAGRAQLLRQLLIESVVLALVSTPLGLAFAWGATTFVSRAVPVESLPSFVAWSVDLRSCLYAVGAAVVTAVAFGLAPALQTIRVDLQGALKQGAAGAGGSASGSHRLLNALVVIEIAVSCVLLAGALLFVRTFLNLERMAGELDARPLLTMRLYMPRESYPSAELRTQRMEDVLRRIESLGTVEAAFASTMVPFGGGAYQGPAAIDGLARAQDEAPVISYVGVTPHLVQTLNVPLRGGRTFTEAEAMSRARVALVSETMARRFWPSGDAVGGRFRLVQDPQLGEWMTVIGVVGDVRQEPVPGGEQLPAAYLPYPYNAPTATVVTIRVRGSAGSVAGAARGAIRQSDSNLAVGSIRPLDDLRQRGYWPYQIFGWVFSIMAVVALCLAAVGVYGVLAYSIARRQREIGVRIALGATRRDVLRLVLLQGLRLTGGGIALGLAGALAVAHVIRSVLYEVSPTDPFTFGVIAAGLSAVAVVTSYLPARQATAVDPIVALRVE